MSIEALEKQVIEWADERDLYRQSTDGSRWDKFEEESEELLMELTRIPMEKTHVKMEAGDVIVTLINLLFPLGLDLETCLAAAYAKIKDRKGKMVNGTFVRDREGE